MAKPVWVQMNTMSSMSVLRIGLIASHCTGSPPKAVTIALRRPIWSPCRASYMNFQMIPAPTNEIATGMKTSTLRNFSPRALSMKTA